MPTYQYQCRECDAALEVQQSFSDDALTVCPACSGSLRKVFNAVGVVFKGSGFYRTDSRASSASGDSGGTDSSSTKSSSDASSSNSSSKESSGTSTGSSSGDSGSGSAA